MYLALSMFMVVGWGIFTPTPVQSAKLYKTGCVNGMCKSGHFNDLELRKSGRAVEYILGNAKDLNCPATYVEISTITECQIAAINLGFTEWNGENLNTKEQRMPYCWLGGIGAANFNGNGDNGASIGGSKLICKRGQPDAPVTAPVTAPAPPPATTPAPAPATTTEDDSLEGCGLAVMGKCYGHIPPDGSLPGNLIEEIGAVDDETTCQRFCKELYDSSCEWFMYDRTTNDCKLFKGSLSDLEDDCTESGYAIQPLYNDCKVANINDHEGCYNFREDYCRFEFSLLDNLESIQTIEDCQLACNYLTNCTFFIYDTPSKTCKLDTASFDGRICDIVHGSKNPSLQECINDGKIPWRK